MRSVDGDLLVPTAESSGRVTSSYRGDFDVVIDNFDASATYEALQVWCVLARAAFGYCRLSPASQMSDCDAAVDCNGNGECSTMDTCMCTPATGWTGESCEICRVGWTGAGCDQCAPGFQGAACDVCLSDRFGEECQFECSCAATGVCNSGKTGDGSCSCMSGYVGTICDEPGYFVTVDAKTTESRSAGNGFAQSYRLDGVEQPTITLLANQPYVFEIEASVPHPFYISTTEQGAGLGEYLDGVENSCAIGLTTQNNR